MFLADRQCAYYIHHIRPAAGIGRRPGFTMGASSDAHRGPCLRLSSLERSSCDRATEDDVVHPTFAQLNVYKLFGTDSQALTIAAGKQR